MTQKLKQVQPDNWSSYLTEAEHRERALKALAKAKELEQKKLLTKKPK